MDSPTLALPQVLELGLQRLTRRLFFPQARFGFSTSLRLFVASALCFCPSTLCFPVCPQVLTTHAS